MGGREGGAHAPMGGKVFFPLALALMRLQMDPFERRNEGASAVAEKKLKLV